KSTPPMRISFQKITEKPIPPAMAMKTGPPSSTTIRVQIVASGAGRNAAIPPTKKLVPAVPTTPKQQPQTAPNQQSLSGGRSEPCRKFRNAGARTSVERNAGTTNKTMPPLVVTVKPMNDVMSRKRDTPGKGTALN